MPEPPEYAKDAGLLRRIGELLYGVPRSAELSVQGVYDGVNEESLLVDAALKKMERSDLLVLDLRGVRVGLRGYGKATFAQNAIAEVVLGRDYIVKRYDRAVVHIIVEADEGESGATGFFISEPSNSIATAAHVVAGRRILRIVDCDGQEITQFSRDMRLGPADLDIAIVQCQTPVGVEPIRVEWNRRVTPLLADLVVFGYPRIAGMYPGLHCSRALLHQTATKYASDRDSLVISATQPGCSGGPVIDSRGFAIGIVEQENVMERAAGTNSFFSATPTHYLRDLV